MTTRSSPPALFSDGTYIAFSDEEAAFSVEWWCCFGSFVALLVVTNLFGSVGAAIYLGIWFLYALTHASTALRALVSAGYLWTFGLFALTSVMWSEAPGLTFRFAVQFLLTLACTFIAARATPARAFLSALLAGMAVAVICSLLFGRYNVDPMTGELTFVGIFASKNYLAFFICVMLVAACCVLVDARQPPVLRILSIAAFVLGIPLLLYTRSATSLVVTAAGVAGFLAAWVYGRLSAQSRALLLLVVLALTALGLFAAAVLPSLSDEFLRMLGKDSTLTGRTYLWAKASEFIAQNPLLGVGFQAFWRQESLEAEALWRYFYIGSRSGFHFHNTYVEVVVELGYVGLAIFILFSLAVVMTSVVKYLRTLDVASSFFLAILLCFIIRSFVEIDIIFQFQLGTVLFYSAGMYALQHAASEGEW